MNECSEDIHPHVPIDRQEEYIKDEMRNLKRELIRAKEV